MSWWMLGLGLLLVVVAVVIVVLAMIHDRVELSEDESDIIRRMIDKGQG